jgi:hypothetical protein
MNDEEMNQLDRRMAEGVIGWKMYQGQRYYQGGTICAPIGLINMSDWQPTRDPAQALEVLRRISIGRTICINGTCVYSLIADRSYGEVSAPTLELAICLFADGVRG